MKSYRNCSLKRLIQSTEWFQEDYHETVLGLSSPEIVSNYIQVLPKHKNLVLVNYEPVDDAINCNSLIGMFNILLHRGIIPTFIDADFCNSIKNSGDDLVYLYNKCKKLNRDISISFTFSIRGVGLEATLDWLSQFNELNTKYPTKYPLKQESWSYRQFAYVYGACIHYRDSGDQMITGVICIKKQQ